MADVIPIKKIDMDDGSLPIAKTALLTLAKTKISGAQRAVIDVIWVETYGWYDPDSPYREGLKKRRLQAQISHKTFIKYSWMGKTEVSRAIKQLIDWKIINRDKNTQPFTYSFNVHVEEWVPEIFRTQSINCSKQDSKQLTGLLTVNRIVNSNQDSEQSVNRIANSWQDESPDAVDVSGSLKKDKENILYKYNSVSGFEGIALSDQLDKLVVLYREKNPNRVKEYGFAKTNIRTRDCFEGAIRQGKVTALQLAETMVKQTVEMAPWDIVKEAAQPPPRQKTERELEMEQWAREMEGR